jgi:hypothetical protein
MRIAATVGLVVLAATAGCGPTKGDGNRPPPSSPLSMSVEPRPSATPPSIPFEAARYASVRVNVRVAGGSIGDRRGDGSWLADLFTSSDRSILLTAKQQDGEKVPIVAARRATDNQTTLMYGVPDNLIPVVRLDAGVSSGIQMPLFFAEQVSWDTSGLGVVMGGLYRAISLVTPLPAPVLALVPTPIGRSELTNQLDQALSSGRREDRNDFGLRREDLRENTAMRVIVREGERDEVSLTVEFVPVLLTSLITDDLNDARNGPYFRGLSAREFNLQRGGGPSALEQLDKRDNALHERYLTAQTPQQMKDLCRDLPTFFINSGYSREDAMAQAWLLLMQVLPKVRGEPLPGGPCFTAEEMDELGFRVAPDRQHQSPDAIAATGRLKATLDKNSNMFTPLANRSPRAFAEEVLVQQDVPFIPSVSVGPTIRLSGEELASRLKGVRMVSGRDYNLAPTTLGVGQMTLNLDGVARRAEVSFEPDGRIRSLRIPGAASAAR